MTTRTTGLITQSVLIAAVLGTFAAVFSIPAAAGQLQGDAGKDQTGTAETQERRGLNFFLRLGDEETGTTSSEPVAPMSSLPTQPASDTNATKNLSINATIMQGDNKTTLPINATVPADAEDVEFCAAVGNGAEVCQPVLLSIDLTEEAGNATEQSPSLTTSAVRPAAFVPVQDTEGLLGDGSLISIEDTSVFIPITVIVPLTVQIQDAQICASVLSSGEMNCTQIVMDPDQTSFTFVDVDLTSDSPTVTSPESTTTTTQQQEETTTTTEPSTNTTTSGDTTTSGTDDGTTTTSPDNTTNNTG